MTKDLSVIAKYYDFLDLGFLKYSGMELLTSCILLCFFKLHSEHNNCKLTISLQPPWLNGTIWSICESLINSSKLMPQLAHLPRSLEDKVDLTQDGHRSLSTFLKISSSFELRIGYPSL